MEKQLSIIFLIKNKILCLMILFLMEMTRSLRTQALAWFVRGLITHRQTRKLLDIASTIHRFAIYMLRFVTPPARKRGI